MIEATCPVCGDTFLPSDDDLVGFKLDGTPLYEHTFREVLPTLVDGERLRALMDAWVDLGLPSYMDGVQALLAEADAEAYDAPRECGGIAPPDGEWAPDPDALRRARSRHGRRMVAAAVAGAVEAGGLSEAWAGTVLANLSEPEPWDDAGWTILRDEEGRS